MTTQKKSSTNKSSTQKNDVDIDQITQDITQKVTEQMDEKNKQALRNASRKAIISGISTSIILIGITVGATAFFLGPRFMDDVQKTKEEQITALQNKYAQVQQKQVELQRVQRNLEQRVTAFITSDLSSQIQQIQNLSAQIKMVNDRMSALQETGTGQQILDSSMQDLQQTILGMQGRVSDIETELEKAKQDNDALSDMLEGISGNELKAAAMLLAVSQLRQSLTGQESFEQDLQTVRVLAGDDPEMIAAIEKIAPYAQTGVLRTDTLKTEFKGLAGDIVMAELSGQDVSWKDKAMHRLDNLVSIRKTGMVDGENTQAIVARAETHIDQGNISEAIAELQKLDGKPAQKAQPWIEAAQARLLSDQLANMIGQNVIENLPRVNLNSITPTDLGLTP